MRPRLRASDPRRVLGVAAGLGLGLAYVALLLGLVAGVAASASASAGIVGGPASSLRLGLPFLALLRGVAGAGGADAADIGTGLGLRVLALVPGVVAAAGGGGGVGVGVGVGGVGGVGGVVSGVVSGVSGVSGGVGGVGASAGEWGAAAWALLLRLARRAPPPDDDYFPEPLGSRAAFTTFTEPPCLLVYLYFTSAVLAFVSWFIYRATTRRRLLSPGRAAANDAADDTRLGGRLGGLFRSLVVALGGRGPRRSGLREPLLPDGGGLDRSARARPRRAEKPTRAPLLVQRLTDAQDRTITFEGFANSGLGSAVSSFVPATSFVFGLLFCTILYDYYSGCEWSWPSQLCYIGTFPLTGTFDTNSYVFLVTWTLGTCWFSVLVWGRGGRMTNLFRVHAPLHEAGFVHVTVKEKRASVSSGYSRTLAWRDKLWSLVARLMGRLLGTVDLPGGVMGLSGGQSQTVPLRWGEQVRAYYIEFRCVCYILDPSREGHGGFIQYEASATTLGGHSAFLDILNSGGLRPGSAVLDACGSGGVGAAPEARNVPAAPPSAEEMYRRAGPNRIPFEVDTWSAALAEEFSTFFFLYQFSIYSVCLWYSYWHFTLLALCVAFSSGFLNAGVRIANQREIKRMMEETSTAEVLRGGELCRVSTEELVPGDVLKVRGDGWPVPCDLLLLRGAAVCDEASLTGESAPVQRLSPTEVLGEFPSSGRVPPKHAIVAGTTVLQVSCEDCWAIATHTGIQTQKGQLLLLILHPPKLLFKYDEQLGVAFAMLICYAIFVMVSTMSVMYRRYAADQQLPFTATWATGIFTCSCVLPTMLHVVLSVGQVMSAQRLQGAEHGVFSAAPKRIALAGKVRVACFDKTGTLTTSGLEFFGVHCVRHFSSGAASSPSTPTSGPQSPFRFGSRMGGGSGVGLGGGGDAPFCGISDAVKTVGAALSRRRGSRSPSLRRRGPLSPLGVPGGGAGASCCGSALEESPRRDPTKMPAEVLCCLAGAHSLSPFTDGAGVVGNSVEVNMFRASGWTLASQSEVLGPACASSSSSSSPFAGAPDGGLGDFGGGSGGTGGGAGGGSGGGPSGVGAARRERLRILKRFDFSHTTMTMSAALEHQPSGVRFVVCKGAFDRVAERCLPSSVPPDFAKVAQAHTLAGKYVLAIAGKPLVPAAGGPVAAAVTAAADSDSPTAAAAASSSVPPPATREDAERDLSLLGLLLFRNPLRPDTKATLAKLREGEVRCVMVTGDASGTAISIAKEAELVPQGAPVLLGDIFDDDGSGDASSRRFAGTVAWKCQDDDLTAMNELLLGNEWLTWRKQYKQWREGRTSGARGEAGDSGSPPRLALGALPPAAAPSAPGAQGVPGLPRPLSEQAIHSLNSPRGPAAPILEQAVSDLNKASRGSEEHIFSTEELVLSRLFEWCELAVTQRAFEWLMATPCSPEMRRALLGSRLAVLKKGKALSSGRGSSTLAWELMTNIRIFARMTPTGKIGVVEGLMQQGLITSMCGDGGNDSGALRAAHVGVALSSATSATVVAPFTTNRPSIAPVADLLREGRAALATSFAGYKYCIHYGLLNSTYRFTKYYHGISQSMSAAYLQDVGGFLSFSWAIGLSRPALSLGGDRPTSSLFSPTTVGSVVGLWVINMLFMRLGMFMSMSHEEFVPFPVHLVRVTQWWKMSRNWETTTLFFLYTFQQFWSAVVFSFGHHFRSAWYTNLYLLYLAVFFLLFLAGLLVLAEPNAITRAFHLVYEPVVQYEPWTAEHFCPTMPRGLRVRMLFVVVANLSLGALWEQVIISGLIGRLLRDRWRFMSKHVTLRL